MTDRLDLDAIKARAAAASEAPWLAITDNGRKSGIGIVGQLAKRGTGEAIAVFGGPDSAQRNADAEFTAHAREDVPALLAEIERLRTALCEAEYRLCPRCGVELAQEVAEERAEHHV